MSCDSSKDGKGCMENFKCHIGGKVTKLNPVQQKAADEYFQAAVEIVKQNKENLNKPLSKLAAEK